MNSAKNEEYLHENQLDRTDRRILSALQGNARLSNQELATMVHLSAAQASRRHRRLEQLGVIQSYETRLNNQSLGLGVIAFVHLTMEPGQFKEIQKFQKAVGKVKEILECHAVTGDFDYVCKVVAKDLRSLSEFLLHIVSELPGVSAVRSSVCLNELKSTITLPVVD